MSTGQVAPFGKLLKRFRLAAGLSQEELAERAGLSPRGVSDLERGARTQPRPSTVRLLADGLGLSDAERTAFLSAAHGGTQVAGAGDKPLATSESPHNLPGQPNPLLGRERELAQLVALLRRDDVRLVTITGPGGIGKTRLSVQVATELLDAFPDGVWNVRLSRLTDPALVVPTIATTLDLKESGALPLADVLRGYLRDKRLLLVLDNFEQVAAAASQVGDLLAVCPGVKALVTSRSSLRVQGEHEYALHPLALPDPAHLPLPEHLSRYAAAALFIERAQAVQADFALTHANAPAVAAICERLDGLPLAIELAAARVKLLPPPTLLTRLDRALPVLTGGPRDLDDRQQTMRNTLAWSYALLAPEEQRLFRRLSVFVGGCTLETAEAVCVAPDGAEPLEIEVLDGLSTLIDQSLVQQREEGGAPRFGMLHVIREFALEQLEATGEAEAMRRAHASFFVALTEQAESELTGSVAGEWLTRLESEHANLRVALGWTYERGERGEQGETETGLRLVAALRLFWWMRGYLREGRAWVEALLSLVVGPGLGLNGGVGVVRGDAAAWVPQRLWARALLAGGTMALWQADDFAAGRWLEQAEALARIVDDQATAATALNFLATLDVGHSDWKRAAMRFEESLTLMRAVGDRWGIAIALNNLGDLAVYQEDLERAATAFAEALALFRQIGDHRGVTLALLNLGWVARKRGESRRATEVLREALMLARDVGDPRPCATGLEYLAATAGTIRQGKRAARLIGAAAAVRETIGTPQPLEERADMTAAVAASRAALGEEAWAVAFAAGQALSLEEAIAEALGEEEAPQVVRPPAEPDGATR